MFLGVDLFAVWSARKAPGGILLTSFVNYAIQPFVGYGVALLFFRVLYTHVIPDAALRDSYIAGTVLLTGAPCTAMVFVWSALTRGDAAYTLVQVAVNDLLMLALYVPTMGLLLGATNLAVSWDLIAFTVAIFVLAPLAVAAAVRSFVLRHAGGEAALKRLTDTIRPFTTVALLLTLVLIFIFQGRVIGGKPLHIVLVSVPLVIMTCAIWALTYGLGFATCMPHGRLAPASLIATSNFFELAVALAVSLYGLESGAVLATVCGVLVEVPVMLALCSVCNKLQTKLERRIARCDDLCAWSKRMDALLIGGCCTSGSVYQ